MPRPAAVLLSATVLLLVWLLFAPPPIGLANNGDFGKLLGYFSLGAPTKDEFWFADTVYSYDPRYSQRSGFYSSELLLIVPALGANRILSKDGHFDLRVIGLIHGALFALAVALFIPLLSGLPAWAQYAPGVAALLMFC